MAVISVYQWEVKPGRRMDLDALLPGAKRVHERLGARVRAWQATFAGPNSARIAYVMEFADNAALAACLSALPGDPEWLAMVPAILGPAAPATFVASIVASTIPGQDDPPLAGGAGPAVSTLRGWSVTPGRRADALARFAKLGEHVHRLGGQRSRVFSTQFTGPVTGALSTYTEFANLKDWAAYADRAAADAEFQAFLGDPAAASIATLASTALRTEIPIA